MEKVKCICVMKALFEALSSLEDQLQDKHGVTLNEAMLLCALGQECLTASAVAGCTGLQPSQVSKLIGTLEKRGLAYRQMGEEDRRQMCLSLTAEGKRLLERLKTGEWDIPSLIRPLFETNED